MAEEKIKLVQFYHQDLGAFWKKGSKSLVVVSLQQVSEE